MSKLRENFLRFIYFLGQNSGCHRIPERCFFYKGYVFPVCARCTGIFFSLPFAIFWELVNEFSIYILLLSAFMFLDWASVRFNILKGNNIKRVITGFFGGFAIHVTQICLIKKSLFFLSELLKK